MKRQNGIEVEILLIMIAFFLSITSYKILTMLGLQHSEASQDLKKISFENLFIFLLKITLFEELIYRVFPFIFAYLTKNNAMFVIIAIASSIAFGYNHGGFWNIIIQGPAGLALFYVFYWNFEICKLYSKNFVLCLFLAFLKVIFWHFIVDFIFWLRIN